MQSTMSKDATVAPDTVKTVSQMLLDRVRYILTEVFFVPPGGAVCVDMIIEQVGVCDRTMGPFKTNTYTHHPVR